MNFKKDMKNHFFLFNQQNNVQNKTTDYMMHCDINYFDM